MSRPSSHKPYEHELQVAVEAAQVAGEVVMQVYASDFEVFMKSGREPVTEADRGASTIIVERLRAAFPGDAVVSEEEKDDGSRHSRSRVWFVDPLDGTKEFVARNGEFSVMIGLSVDGVARLGVVYMPASGRRFIGVDGLGAFDGDEAIEISQVDRVEDLRLVVSRSHRNKFVDEVKEMLKVTAEKPSGSVGIKAGLIAAAEADLYVNPSHRSKRWDVCAAEAVLHAAGGRMTDLYGDPIDYRTEDLFNRRGLVASNGRVHDEVIVATSQVAKRMGL